MATITITNDDKIINNEELFTCPHCTYVFDLYCLKKCPMCDMDIQDEKKEEIETLNGEHGIEKEDIEINKHLTDKIENILNDINTKEPLTDEEKIEFLKNINDFLDDKNETYEDNHLSLYECPHCTFKFNDYVYNQCPMCGIDKEDFNETLNGDFDNHISSNLEKALNEIPESLIKYSSHVICKINDVEVDFLIDTGAMVSLLPSSIIEKCKLTHLIDKNFQSNLIGVGGTSKTGGRLHYVNLDFPCGSFPCGFTCHDVLDNKPILGLDVILNLNIKLDYSRRKMIIGEHEIDIIIRS